MTDLADRCDVYLHGPTDRRPDALREAAKAGAKRLAVSEEQLSVLLMSPRAVRVRSRVDPSIAWKLVDVLRECGIVGSVVASGSPAPQAPAAAAQPRPPLQPDVTTSRVRKELPKALEQAATGEFMALLSSFEEMVDGQVPGERKTASPPGAVPLSPRALAATPPQPVVMRPIASTPPVGTRPAAQTAPLGSRPVVPPASMPPSGPRPPASASPPGTRPAASTILPGAAPATGTTSPVAAALRAELEQKSRSLEGVDHYSALGVQKGARKEDIKRAYVEVAKVFHPDRITAQGFAALRPLAEKVFSRLSEAHAVLTDDQKRAAYDAAPSEAERAQVEAAVELALDAERQFQMGQSLLKQHHYARAEQHLERAYKASPDAEHQLLLAWARFNNPAHDRTAMRVELLQALTRAAKDLPQLARTHVFAGELFLSEGDADKAFKAYQRALQLDPNDVDAARGLRLAETRKQKSAKPFWKR